MPKYIYKAKKGPHDIIEGAVEAKTYNSALRHLSSMGYFPISVHEEAARLEKRLGAFPFVQKKLRTTELSMFTRQLSELLSSGMPLLPGLQLLGQQSGNKQLQAIIADLIKSIQGGSTLSEGLAKHPRTFSNFYMNITKSGELGGKMEHSLDRLADFLDKEEEMISRIRQAMAYPLLMCAVGFLTIILLITVIIPRLVVMFEDAGQALPLPTLIVMSISDFMLKYGWLVVLSIGVVVFTIKRAASTIEGRRKLDRIKINLPLLGAMAQKVEIARFSRTLATLLDSGIPILDALDSVVSAVQNEVMKDELKKVRQDVRDGASLGRSLAEATQIPPYVINMITVGEEGGQLEKVLYRIAVSYERQTDKAISLMMTLLEPALILVMGVVVGFIVVAMLLPIFQFNIMIQ